MLLLLHRSGVVVANVEPLSLRHDGVQVEEEKGWRGRRGLEKEQDAEAEAEAEAQTPLILKYRSLCPRLHLITFTKSSIHILYTHNSVNNYAHTLAASHVTSSTIHIGQSVKQEVRVKI